MARVALDENRDVILTVESVSDTQVLDMSTDGRMEDVTDRFGPDVDALDLHRGVTAPLTAEMRRVVPPQTHSPGTSAARSLMR